MSDTIEVGDLVEHQGIYAVVYSVDLGYVWGHWEYTAERAKAVTPAPHACVDAKDCAIVEKAGGAMRTRPTSRGQCTCQWSMLVKGCACGAIKPYKMEIGR